MVRFLRLTTLACSFPIDLSRHPSDLTPTTVCVRMKSVYGQQVCHDTRLYINIGQAFRFKSKGRGTLSHGAPRISFSGYEWEIKSGAGIRPGPNNWSAGSDNVWLDAIGQLHLRLSYREGKWYAAETTLLNALGHGDYVFYVASRVDQLDRNIVVGLFIYSNDANEIDIEFSRWGSLATNAQYVVQPPPYTDKNLHRFAIRLNGNYSTHRLVWLADSISFRSLHGHYPNPPDKQSVIAEWVYRGYIPQVDVGRAHINMWLYKGDAPSDGRAAELIIKKFEFVPASNQW